MRKIIAILFISLSILTACGSENAPQINTPYKSKIHSKAMVTIEIAPKSYDEERWIFDVTMSTHSVELDYDLSKLTILTDGSGMIYENPEWDGDPPEGHHRVGQLIFTDVDDPSEFTLNIQDVEGVEDRIFEW